VQHSCLENDWLRVQGLSHRFTPLSWAVVFRGVSSDLLFFIYNSESVACWETEEPSSGTGSLPLLAKGLIQTSRSQRIRLFYSRLVNKQLCSRTSDSLLGRFNCASLLAGFISHLFYFLSFAGAGVLCLCSFQAGDCWEMIWGVLSAVDILMSAFVHPSHLLSGQDHKQEPWLSRICLEGLRWPPVPSGAG